MIIKRENYSCFILNHDFVIVSCVLVDPTSKYKYKQHLKKNFKDIYVCVKDVYMFQ